MVQAMRNENKFLKKAINRYEVVFKEIVKNMPYIHLRFKLLNYQSPEHHAWNSINEINIKKYFPELFYINVSK